VGTAGVLLSVLLFGAACGGEADGVEASAATTATAEVPLLEICAILQHAASTGDAETFVAECERFVSSKARLEELLQALETQPTTEAELDQLMGTLDFSMRMLAEESTSLCPELAENSEVYVDRILHSLLTLQPKYARVMLERWSSWGYFQDRHAQTLVSFSLLPEARTIGLQTLAGLDSGELLSEDDYLILDLVSQNGMLSDADRRFLARIRMGRGAAQDVDFVLSILDDWGNHPNPWGFVGYCLDNVQKEEVARRAIEGLGGWKRSGRWPALEVFEGANEVVTELAAEAFFHQDSARQGTVCLALAVRNQEFLEAVSVEAPSFLHRCMALEGLVLGHLRLEDSIAKVSHLLDREKLTIADSGSKMAAFMQLLVSLAKVASHEEHSALEDQLEDLLVASRSVYSDDGFDTSFESLRTVMRRVTTP